MLINNIFYLKNILFWFIKKRNNLLYNY